GLRLGDNDTRILAVAANLREGGDDVVVVSKDLPMRVKAAIVGLAAEEYRAELAAESGWSGMITLTVTDDQQARLWEEGVLDLADAVAADLGRAPEPDESADPVPVHAGVVLRGGRGDALARVGGDGRLRLGRGDRELFGLRGRSAEQRVALDLLLDEDIGI